MRNPFKRGGDTHGISINANGLKERAVKELTISLIKILQTQAGDAVKQTAINALSNASRSEISQVSISNVSVQQGDKK